MKEKEENDDLPLGEIDIFGEDSVRFFMFLSFKGSILYKNLQYLSKKANPLTGFGGKDKEHYWIKSVPKEQIICQKHQKTWKHVF